MRVLVVGGDSVIGRALIPALRAGGHSATGTTRRRMPINPTEVIFLDLASDEPVVLPHADAMVICAAMARFEECRAKPELARRVNVSKPMEIAERVLSNGGRVLLLSSSAVFDCLSPRRKADSPRSPRSIYGQLKAEAETRLLNCGAGASVLRITKVLRPDSGILAEWVERLGLVQTVEAFEDHRFCPLPLRAVTDAIMAILEASEDGIFQVSGAADVSYFDAARHIAVRIGAPIVRVTGVRAVDRGIPDSEVTPYTSLDSRRLDALAGFVPPQPFAVIDEVFQSSIARLRA